MSARPPRRRSFPATVLVFATVIVASSAAAGPEPIALPAAPPATRTVVLEEAWRIGADDEDILLGLVIDAARDDAGNVYLLDHQLAQVDVVGPDGELVATLGRAGDGPGEFRQPGGLYLRDDGGVGVVEVFPAKIVLLTADGVPDGQLEFGGDAAEGGFRFVEDVQRAGDCLVARYGRATFDTETGRNSSVTTLTVMDLAGQVVTDLLSHAEERDLDRFVFDEAAAFSELETWTALPGCRICTVPERAAYRINVRERGGDVVRTLERPFTPRRRSEADREDVVAGMTVTINGVRQEIENKALHEDPAIMSLHAAADGRLFVVNCHQQRKLLAPGVAARYDVIAPDGTFVEELVLRIEGFDHDDDRLMFLDGRDFVLIRNFDQANEARRAGLGGAGDETADAASGDDEPLEVVYYRGA